MNVFPDTIFALSSGQGRSGVAVIRLSGPAALDVVAQLAGGAITPRRASLRALRQPSNGQIIDHGIVLTFPAPASFTGEDCAELQVHGSVAVLRALLGTLAEYPGLRHAESGEFTRRAFLNGRMSLLDVEALGDLLVAETEMQRRLALESASHFAACVDHWRESLLDLQAEIEAGIDFMDEGDVIDRLDSDAQRKIDRLIADMQRSLAGARLAERIRTGLRVAILGPPNAGKSSLLNALAKRDLAITSPIPGTTRDSLEAQLDLDGLPVRLVDTAGLRSIDTDPIEIEGMRRARMAADVADCVLWLSPVDAPEPAPDSRFVTVMTKVDLLDSIEGDDAPLVDHTGRMALSIRTGQGLDELITFVRQQALGLSEDIGMAGMVANERQQAHLRGAVRCLSEATAESALE